MAKKPKTEIQLTMKKRWELDNKQDDLFVVIKKKKPKKKPKKK